MREGFRRMRRGLVWAFRGRHVLVTLLVVAASGVMVRLGFWQLDRLAQRRAYNARVLAQLTSPKVDLNREALTIEDPEAYRYRGAFVRGRFVPEDEILVRNRFYQGRPGYRVLTPLRIEGFSEPWVVMVDRGWMPEPLPEFVPPPPQGTVEVHGYLMPGETAPDNATPPAEGEAWFWIDLRMLDDRRPYRVLPFYLVQTPPEGEVDTTPPIQSPRQVTLTEGPHLGYAIQWFLFAAVLPLVYFYQVGKEGKSDPTARG